MTRRLDTPPPHGTRNRYQWSQGRCRCAACRAANAAYKRAWWRRIHGVGLGQARLLDAHLPQQLGMRSQGHSVTVVHDLGCSEPCTCGAWDRTARETAMPYRYEIYEAKDGWRWRCVAGNGEVVADGAEAYDSKSNAERAVEALKDDAVDRDAG